MLKKLLNLSHIDYTKEAIVDKRHRITFQEVDDNIRRYALYLQSYGVKKGDKVILRCINGPEFIYAYLATVYIGAVIVPINVTLTFTEAYKLMEDCGAQFILVHEAIYSVTRATKTKRMIEKETGLKIQVFDAAFKKAIKETPLDEIESKFDENEACTFIYTSGTTGNSKAAMLTLKNLRANIQQMVSTVALGDNERWISCLPMFHSFGFTVSVLFPLSTGGSMIIVEQFAPKTVMELLVKEKITIFSGVPSMYIVLADTLAKSEITSLRIGWAGGAAISPAMNEYAAKKLNFDLCEGYGLSEASPVCALNITAKNATEQSRYKYKDYHKIGSIGPTIMGVEAKIVNDLGEELPLNEVGELAVKGDNVMLGYYNCPEATAETIKDGWLLTGDLGKIDEDGYIYIVDRKKDMIIVGGFNVYSQQVEDAIAENPKVLEAAVFGIPDKLRGEAVVAYVRLRPEETLAKNELKRYLKEFIAPYKMPKYISVVENFPRNATGKIMKKELRAALIAEKGLK